MFLGNDCIVSRLMAEQRNKLLQLHQARLKAITSELFIPLLEKNRIHPKPEGLTRIRKKHNHGSICVQKNLPNDLHHFFHFLEHGFHVYFDISSYFVVDHAKNYGSADDTLMQRSKNHTEQDFPWHRFLRHTKKELFDMDL